MQLLEDGADVRARKSALMEVIELQQRLIQRRDLDSTTTGDDTEEEEPLLHLFWQARHRHFICTSFIPHWLYLCAHWPP